MPSPPLKRCHHRIAGNRCPGTSFGFCSIKQTTISDKSSEVSPLLSATTQFLHRPPRLLGVCATIPGWHGARWLAHGGWHGEKDGRRWIEGRFSTGIPPRTFNGHCGNTRYNFTLSSIFRFDLPLDSLHVSRPLSSAILLHCPQTLSVPLLSLPVSPSLFRPVVSVPRWHQCGSMEVCFCSSSILILLAPSPVPMPAPAQVLTGWHCANLPPPSLSFVAHPSVALPPVSTFPSLSLPLVSFIHFFTHFLFPFTTLCLRTYSHTCPQSLYIYI